MGRADVPQECRWCGRPDENNPGDYYHEKECHRRDVLRRMDTATPEEMPKLKRELFDASYTGD